MIGRILQRRYALGADLLAAGEAQQLIDAQMPATEEHVVDRVAALTIPADLPRGVLGFVTLGLAVGRVQLEADVRSDGLVDGLDGLGVEIAAQDHRTVVAEVLLEEVEDVFALFVAQRRQKGTLTRLEMGRGHADLLTGDLVSQDRQNNNLQQQ